MRLRWLRRAASRGENPEAAGGQDIAHLAVKYGGLGAAQLIRGIDVLPAEGFFSVLGQPAEPGW
jgi:hypothetical protein